MKLTPASLLVGVGCLCASLLYLFIQPPARYILVSLYVGFCAGLITGFLTEFGYRALDWLYEKYECHPTIPKP